MKPKGRFYRINHYVSGPKVRVISEKGENLGVLTKEEALRLCQEKGLDLVEITSNTSPPVCKIIDFKKFIYEQKKRQQKGVKKSSHPELKEVRISLFMASHDLQRSIEKAKQFLKKGEIVKFRLLFKGREISKKNIGLALFQEISQELKEITRTVKGPEIKGRILEMTLKTSQK